MFNFPTFYTADCPLQVTVRPINVWGNRPCQLINEEDIVWSWFCFSQHYEKDADGLCTELRQPLKKKGNFEFAVDKQAFVDQGWVIKFKDIKLGEAIGKGEFAGSVPLWKMQ